MNVPLLDLTAQYASIKEEVDAAVEQVVASQYFVLGPEVEALEAEIAEYVGAKHAIGCASGTDALLLPLKAMDAEACRDVIVPSFTFFATAGAVWNAGFRPVFCDVDPDTFNVTAETLEAAWTDETVAVIPVHLFGQMAPMDEIMELAEERGAFVLEDAGAYSFFPTKNLGGFGDGGMVVTDDDELADKVGKLRVHGGRQMYHHEMVGTNSRLDALQAAVLRVKLRHLDDWAAKRGENACAYFGALADVDGIRLPEVADGNTHVYNQFTVRAERRDALREHLSAEGVGSGVYDPVPRHMQACFSGLGYGEGDLPVTEALCTEVLSLPIFPELGRDRLERVADVVRGFYQNATS